MPKKILIVDDETGVVEATKSILEKRGYEVCAAYNGVQGLETVKKEKPDLILADVLMPEMDGFVFYKELKKNLASARIPVLIVTGRGKMEESFKALGVDGFICKPFTPQQLCDQIADILSLSERQQSLPESEKKRAKRVLVVGSIDFILNDMVTQGRHLGLEVDVARNGAEAIVKAIHFVPDIILLDVQLEDMSVSEAVEVLSRLPKFAKKPILGYSYYPAEKLDDPSTRQKMLNIDAAKTQFQLSGGGEYLGRFSLQPVLKSMMDHLYPDIR